jgi:SWI/SNF-related matrix-associated actin-dependent regulator of chromatin subfamily A member 5
VAELHSTHCGPKTYGDKIYVEKSLPKKTSNVLRVGRNPSQQQRYRWLLTKNFAKLNEGTSGKGMGPKITLRSLIMELKKCCNHPYLFESIEVITVKTTVESLISRIGQNDSS